MKELFLKYWIREEFKDWDIIFKKEEENSKLYYIVKWEVLLITDKKNIALVWEWEIIGEKSFLQKKNKPISASANKDTQIISIDSDNFDNMSESDKTRLLKELNLFLSERIYLLNDIVSNLSKINENISLLSRQKSSFESIKEIFQEIIKIESLYVYRPTNWSLLPIFESKISMNLNLKWISNRDNYFNRSNVLIDKDWTILIKTNEYIFQIKWENKKENYITNNVLMHCIYSLNYLWNILEEQKNNALENLLKN